MSVLVIVPAGTAAGDWPGCEVVAGSTAAEAVRALGKSFSAAVVVSDGLAGEGLVAVAAAVAACGRPVIEVRSGRWDGVEPSPLSAACRGVISGFGMAGVREALRVLEPA